MLGWCRTVATAGPLEFTGGIQKGEKYGQSHDAHFEAKMPAQERRDYGVSSLGRTGQGRVLLRL